MLAALLLPIAALALDPPLLGQYQTHRAMRADKELPLDNWMQGFIEAAFLAQATDAREGRPPAFCPPALSFQEWTKRAPSLIDEYLAASRKKNGSDWPATTPLQVVVMSSLRWKYPCRRGGTTS